MSLTHRGPPPQLVKTEDRSFGATTDPERRYAALYEQLYPRLCDYVARVMDRADAEDLVQEAFYRIWKRWDTVAIDNPGQAYFFKSVRNAVADALVEDPRPTARIVHVEIDELEGGSQPDEALEAAERRRTYDLAVSALPPRCREAWVLCRDNSYSYEQAGEIMGLHYKTVKNHLHHATRLVREALVDAGYLEAVRAQRSLPPGSANQEKREGNQP